MPQNEEQEAVDVEKEQESVLDNKALRKREISSSKKPGNIDLKQRLLENHLQGLNKFNCINSYLFKTHIV